VGNQGSHKASLREAEKTPLLPDVSLHYGDCLEVMNSLSAHSINLILCDLPYGLTQNKWDSEIPLEPLWVSYKRLLADNGVIALTASQPFTSALVMSNLSMFKHEWVWIKNRGSNFANTVREPMKEHESVLVFAGKRWTYNKQMQERTGGGLSRSKYLVEHNDQLREGTRQFEGRPHHSIPEMRVPSSWQKFNIEVGLHPTQKPVPLFRYLVRTYSNPGDTVLDNCMGSGTTGVAAIEEGREFIGIENDERYFSTACERLS
jgi:site-specific DNA-methyltransferase (adenine-specific)